MWGWPQWAIIALFALGLAINAVRNGEPRTGNHEFSWTVIGVGINAWILWMGGFWS